MRMQNRVLGLISVILILAIGIATLHAAESRHKINAKSVGQDLGGSVVAESIGGGLLNGTSLAHFTVVGACGPTAVRFAGDIVFSTKHGTLTVSVSGCFDVSTGEFNSSGPVTDATDKLAGATGSLTFDGVEDLFTGQFTSTIRGEIVVDLSK